MKKQIVNPRIVIPVTKEEYETWSGMMKEVKQVGVRSNIVGRFVVDRLAALKSSGYRDLIKYL